MKGLKNNKSLYWGAGFILLFLALWNLFTLQYSPIPWIDEVYFASVTKSLIDGNGLTLSIGLDNPVYHYGPIYFILTALSVKIGGFNLFFFRLVELFFSFATAFSICSILRRRGLETLLIFAFVILFLTDPLLVYCSHIGRMELVSCFFVLSAILIYERQSPNEVFTIVCVSLLLVLSLLTTSRSAVIILPFGLTVFISTVKRHKWGQLSLLLGLPLICLFSWIFISYGSIPAFLDYFINDQTSSEGSFITRFVGGSFIISKTHYPLVLLSIVVIVDSIINKYFKKISVFVFTILLFYLVVKSSSDTYSVMILPFYYLIIGQGIISNRGISERKRYFNALYISLFGLCLIINMGIFVAKWALIESSKEARNEKLALEWISKNIPAGSTVVGSDAYYYACIDNSCTFKSFEQIYSSDTETMNYILNDLHADYVVFNKEESIREAILLFDLIPKEKVDHYEPICSNKWLADFLIRVGLVNHSTFEGDLYRIVY